MQLMSASSVIDWKQEPEHLYILPLEPGMNNFYRLWSHVGEL
jgi:hypothetical protein